MREDGYRIAFVEDPGLIEASQWDRLVAGDPHGNVFLSHAFLHALHASGAARDDAGWSPRWVTLWSGGRRLEAAIPLYWKSHSFGEYVFDWSWAQAYERAGLPYYPKWLVAVPFTPVEGSRILAADETGRVAAASALLALARASEVSSLHVLFAPPGQVDALAQAGLLVRSSLQFHWRNRPYADFEEFLAALTQPKRKKIRAERRKVAQAGVSLRRIAGAQIGAADWEFFFRCYRETYARHGSSPYLNLDFFRRLGRSMQDHLVLVLAERHGRRIAGALGLWDRGRSALYGRYWGALETVDCLHFECCYYQMIEFAIEQGLQTFEGGAQGAHKLARGLDPAPTYSAHWLRDAQMRQAVALSLARERLAVAAAIDELGEHRAFREHAARY
jgi:hypothetical protein